MVGEEQALLLHHEGIFFSKYSGKKFLRKFVLKNKTGRKRWRIGRMDSHGTSAEDKTIFEVTFVAFTATSVLRTAYLFLKRWTFRGWRIIACPTVVFARA